MSNLLPNREQKTHPEVELIRLYTDGGRYKLGLVALALRKGLFGTIAVLIAAIAKLAIERLL